MGSSFIDSQDVILKLRGLYTGYSSSERSKKHLHNNLNCEVKKGELIAILGPNGAGKSTLLKSLSGIISPLRGTIDINGKDLKKMSNKEVSKEISMVLTDKIDDRYLTAYDIVGTGRYPYGSFMGKLTQYDKEKIENSFNLLEASELKSRYYINLSDGEKQKVLLARAIAQDTQLIFLDEPTAFIDSPGKVVIMNFLFEFASKYHKSILMTTHDTELALNFATRLWLLGKNNMFVDGKPDVLMKKGMINKLFDRKGVTFNAETRRFESYP